MSSPFPGMDPYLEKSATTERAMQVRRIMNESLRQRTPQDRDRTMQVHMAQARGATANAFLLRCAMNFAIRLRKTQTGTDVHDDR